MLSLSLDTPPQDQLEALRVLPDYRSGTFCLHASIALLDLFDSARFKPSGRLVFSHGPSQLPCCCSVGASPAAFSSTWASVDSVHLNQTSEPTRLTPICFSLSSELAVSNSSLVSLPSMTSSPPCIVGFGSLLRLLPFSPHPDFSADPPSASSADPKSNSASDSVSQYLPLLSYSLAWSLETLLPLKLGTSR